ncbi:aminoglycoside phosphotransferase family protein [Halorarum halophilum]|uniref:Aminoglycoside phosphotransferase family protein n=1 Tax=Halorarum halophilum TaxID=2743090 RepID=A0A7D5KXV3_9EURY|nr:aminoglycoside phosphotransferase family protein [Halobaculum halophilum]QLG28798.1 aminoglycoside phosphotransferase family protein [Halobaculum halophilum]
MRLDADAAVEYLEARGRVPEGARPVAEPLGGGVSNDVFRVSWDDDAVVLKQPLPDLAVADDWPADVGRVHNEAAAARVYAAVLDDRGMDGVAVPAVRFEDHEEHVIGISSAPESARMWKSDLLDGTVDPGIAATVGEFLAAAHDYAADDGDLEEAFGNYVPFEQLRLDPYHRTVAERHPDLAPAIEREIERIRSTRSTLVHGDYSPKNVLVDDTDRRPHLWLLDFEVAHWGDPAFDVAFMLNHLFIKSVYLADRRDEYVSAAEAFWEAYRDTVETTPIDETDVVRELGVLMLARVDGKSPVEYVEQVETKETLRALARRILTGDVGTVAELASIVREEVDGR